MHHMHTVHPSYAVMLTPCVAAHVCLPCHGAHRSPRTRMRSPSPMVRTACARIRCAPGARSVIDARPAHALAHDTTHKRSSARRAQAHALALWSRPLTCTMHGACTMQASCLLNASCVAPSPRPHPRPSSQCTACTCSPMVHPQRMRTLAHGHAGKRSPCMPSPMLATDAQHTSRNALPACPRTALAQAHAAPGARPQAPLAPLR